MRIGIQKDLIGEESYSSKWAQAIVDNGEEVVFLDLFQQNAIDQASQCDGIMWRWAHNPNDKQSAKQILYSIEKTLHIPVFPNDQTAWHFDDKIAQFYLLRGLNAPIPDTFVFWNQDDALDWTKHTPYPLVFKLSCGAGSANVVKINNFTQANFYIEKMFFSGIFPYTFNEYSLNNIFPTKTNFPILLSRFRNAWSYFFKKQYPPLPSNVFWKPEFGYAYFQEFLENNSFDTRISVIGDRAFGFRRMNRVNDFRASGSGKIEYDFRQIDKKCIQIAFDVSQKGNFQSMAYDFLYKDGKPVICEISYAFADNAVHNCPGHWDRNLNWIDGPMWPETAQVEDFINYIRSTSQSKNSHK